MTETRTFHGIEVRVERGIPSPDGENVRITFPDGSSRVSRLSAARNLDVAAAFEVDVWRGCMADGEIRELRRVTARTKEAA